MGKAIIVLLAIALAVWIGVQLGDQALAVVVGAVFGVIAGVPTSLLLLLALARHNMQRHDQTVIYYPDSNKYLE